MKLRLVILSILVVCINSYIHAQSDTTTKKPIIKTGWNFGALPVVAYNSDLGFQYGVLTSPFYYGDGSKYPNYIHKIYFEASRYTKGSGIYRLYFQSKYLIPNINSIFDVSYLPDLAYDFYGFNGSQSIFHKDWIDKESPNYVSSYFYKTQKKLFRVKAEFQGATKIENLGWALGIQFRNISYSRPNFTLLNKDKSGTDVIPSDSTLFDKYVQWGFIPNKDKNGGIVSTIKTGLVYDTRDFDSNPAKGIWTEAIIAVSPSFLGTNSSSFGVFNFTHRQYFTLIPKKLIFAYRGVFQAKLFGEMPFYILPEIETTVLTSAYNEGLGGSNSLRGVLRNKVIGEQMCSGNFELRYKFLKFKIKKQNMYLATNIFYDAGAILKPIDIPINNLTSTDQNLYFSNTYKGIHSTAGMGLKIVMNENFIVSVEYGKALSKQDGNKGMYIRLNYLF